MAQKVSVPVQIVNKERWGQLSFLAEAHEFCGEKVTQLKDMSYKNGHRVRLYRFKKNVGWRVPETVDLDITSVLPPKRRQW